MRLKEEKILMILAVFGLLLILITIFIQIADSRIHDYEVKIQNKGLLLISTSLWIRSKVNTISGVLNSTVVEGNNTDNSFPISLLKSDLIDSPYSRL